MAAAFAVPAGRLADRFGQRASPSRARSLFAPGFAWSSWRLGPTPALRLADFLPGLLVGGAGVGLMHLDARQRRRRRRCRPTRFATGSAIVGDVAPDRRGARRRDPSRSSRDAERGGRRGRVRPRVDCSWLAPRWRRRSRAALGRVRVAAPAPRAPSGRATRCRA